MMNVQSFIDELAKNYDNRTSVFEIEVQEFTDETLKLSGRLLEESQLDDLRRALPDLKLDTASVRILSRESHEHMHVATNLTGLYEKPTFGMPLSSELTYGTDLEVLDVEKRWAFTRQRDGYLGWTYQPYLAHGAARPPTHLLIAPAAELRAKPNPTAEVFTRIFSGTSVVVEDTREGWSCISANRSGWIRSSHLRAFNDMPASVEEKRDTLIEDAQRMIGVPYLWGGMTGNGIDCSGFARLLHRWVGIEIPRDADMQCAAAKPIEPPFEIGDLLFFGEGDSSRDITHVGISLGGWKMIHSSRGNNGVYVDDVQVKKTLMDIYICAGSFLRQA